MPATSAFGMVFLEHTTTDGKPNILALSARCPHLGCFVDFNSGKSEFECPCHKSAFAKDGNYIFGPSLRGLDPLKVDLRKEGDATEVYVAFQKFQPGIAERKPADESLPRLARPPHRLSRPSRMRRCYEHIPGGARWRYVWGSTLSFCFFVQVVTGFILWAAYSPSAQTAWESVYYIQNQMTLGWLLRGVHHFTAQMMVVLMVVHFVQVVIDGAYRAPREINFWLGLILMQIVLGLALTGYLLPWDQKGYWATSVATRHDLTRARRRRAAATDRRRRQRLWTSHADALLRTPCRRAAGAADDFFDTARADVPPARTHRARAERAPDTTSGRSRCSAMRSPAWVWRSSCSCWSFGTIRNAEAGVPISQQIGRRARAHRPIRPKAYSAARPEIYFLFSVPIAQVS